MKPFCLPLLFILYLFPSASPVDPVDKVAELIKQGNVHELSKLFAANIEVTILGDENNYSKDQAEFILDKFFSQNKPKTVKMLHKINSNPNYRFGVLIVNTDKGPYRVAYTLKGSGGDLAIIELRIETEKVK